ncbi:MAG: YgfZ/GcvT domain-containing protein [Acidobacteriota bacterium]
MSESSDYQACRERVGLIDLSANGKLRLTGGNAVQFLNGLVSNDVKSLEAGEGVLVAFPNLQGRLLALARVWRIGEALLLEVDEINREKVGRNLSRFVPAGNFFVADETATMGMLALLGPEAPRIIAALGVSLPPSERREMMLIEVVIDGVAIQVARHRRSAEEGFDLFIPREGLGTVREKLTSLGVVGVSAATFETIRIEDGIPREGVDTGEEYIILETGLEEAISYTKGCYLGQEVIARIHWRGQPARRLRGLRLDLPREQVGESLAEFELTAIDGAQAGRKVGHLTSSTYSEACRGVIALGYVHRHYLAAGTVLEVRRKEEKIGEAVVSDLPFRRQSTRTD